MSDKIITIHMENMDYTQDRIAEIEKESKQTGLTAFHGLPVKPRDGHQIFSEMSISFFLVMI